ncbi:MAG: CDP-alcohol phosphatidyltransferase family protein [Myxococcales bacterium]|nr:CDP-alcohol phosphatidyltransferase family protein [Myxococcales bacterium]
MMQGERAEADVYPVLVRHAAWDGLLTLTFIGIAVVAVVQTADLSLLAFGKAATVPVLLLLLVAPHLREHTLHRLGAANRLTLLRSVLVSVMAAFVLEPAAELWSWALVGLACAAFALDWVDGRVARATGTASPFGARLDEELDGLTVLVLAALALTLGRAGIWVLLAGLARYLYLAATRVFPFMAKPLPHTPRRAIACGLGVTALLACLAPWSLVWFGPALAATGTIILVGSFAIDVVWLVQRAWE